MQIELINWPRVQNPIGRQRLVPRSWLECTMAGTTALLHSVGDGPRGANSLWSRGSPYSTRVPHASFFDICDADSDTFAQNPGRACNGLKRDRDVLRIEEAVKLRAARVKFLRHGLLGLALLPHRLLQLPSEYPLDGDRFGLLSNAFFLKEAVKAGSAMIEWFLGGCPLHWIPLSCLLLFLRASSRSSSGVFCVFLMKPCRSTIRFFLST